METQTKAAIQPLTAAHFPSVTSIYDQGIASQNATLETKAPTWQYWDQGHLPHSRWVAVSGTGQVVGWAALSPVSGRCVYGGVAEVSVYIEESARNQGIGSLLLQALITSSEQNGIWTLQAGILKENEASVAMHLKNGFRMVGLRERIGQLHGQWRDTYLLERRSHTVGV
ncbi:GNAT family N-acetyltransferase [Nibribacter ruber]|uniref:GNAT family N-acetyltransferase n=1 Tax=Nibribacter ruber TaxID=2698458 RepID=A0A6P1P3N3_9BACT|nr:GNAT family N-acetyltransferase [Nibribacter ruber]QHL89039.1 GNAT family N-acetyltransferase [Nibribacter ruber]